MKKYKFVFVIFILSLFFISDAVSYSDLVPVKNKNGMYQAEFKLDRGGVVKVNLPSDMALRENVSGSMVYNGNINQFQLLIENKLVPMSGNNFNFTLPANVSTGVLNVLLRFSNGIDIGSAFFPINVVKLKKFRRESDQKVFDLPVYGSSGVPVDVEGEFDGNYRNTIVTLSGKRMKVLAESTTRTVFVTTNDHSGPGVLKLSELGKNAETKFTNLVVVKIEDRVKEPETILGYEQSDFEEKEFKEISNQSDLSLPPDELHQGNKKANAFIAKKSAPKTIGNQDNTLLTKNPSVQTKVVPKKEVVKPVVNQNIIKNPDNTAVKKALDEQFSSKFYSNDPVETKKNEVALAKSDLKEEPKKKTNNPKESSTPKIAKEKIKEVSASSPKETNEKPVVTKVDDTKKKEIVPVKKETTKVKPKPTETKSVAKLSKENKDNVKDYSLVKKDINKQFSSKINTPDEENKKKTQKKEVAKVKAEKGKKPIVPKKTVEKKKELKPKVTKKEPSQKNKIESKKVNEKPAKKSIAKDVDNKKRETIEKPKAMQNKAATDKQKKETEIAKAKKYQPSVSEYSPLIVTPKKNVKTEKVEKEKPVVSRKVISKKNEIKSVDKDEIHTVVPPSADIKKGSKPKNEISKTVNKKKQDEITTKQKQPKQKISEKKSEKDIKSAKSENIKKSGLTAKKEKDSKDSKAPEKKGYSVKTAKPQKNIDKKKQTVKNDKKDIPGKLNRKNKSKKTDKKVQHTVVPKTDVKKISVAKAKKDLPQKKQTATKSKSNFCVQLASFKKQSEVNAFISKMRSQGYEPNVKQVEIPKKGKWNRVRICNFDTRSAAESFISKGINKKSLNISSPYVTVY